MAINKPCVVSGCAGYAIRGMYCEAHAPKRQPFVKRQREEKLPLYSTDAWQRLRQLVLSEQPLCARCGTAAATVVHHLRRAKDFPELALVRSNLEALCATCHNRESQKEATADQAERRTGAQSVPVSRLLTPVTCVFAPPGSAGRTYIKNAMLDGDLIVDLGGLIEVLSYGSEWVRSAAPYAAALNLREALLRALSTEVIARRAWVLTSSRAFSEKLRALGAHVVQVVCPLNDALAALDSITDEYRNMAREAVTRFYEEL